MTDLAALLGLAAIALIAASVNGAIGYGFSSITVPLALLFTTSRVLNPALVVVEVGVNLHALVVNRASVPGALRRVVPLAVGAIPGVVVGSLVVASVSSDAVKLATYLVLLPLILAQVGGLRRPFRSERAVGVPVGAGVGALYSVTTISGPPLALFLSNQGYVERDFRASIAIVRLVESALTAAAYAVLGLYTPASIVLVPWIFPAVVVGVPLGAALMRRVDAETFRRVAMSFSALVVAFGLARVLDQAGIVAGVAAYAVVAPVAPVLLALLQRSTVRPAATAPVMSGTGGD